MLSITRQSKTTAIGHSTANNVIGRSTANNAIGRSTANNVIGRSTANNVIGRSTAGRTAASAIGAWCCRMQNSRACNMAGLFAYADCAFERCQNN